MSESTYFVVSNMGGTLGRNGVKGRWELTTERIDEWSVRRSYEFLAADHEIPAADVPTLEFNAEKDGPYDDWPFVTFAFPFVVSDRVRQVLQPHCRPEFQWFPAAIFHRGKQLDVQYWVIHPGPSLVCADESYHQRKDEDTGYIWSCKVDPRAVPPNCKVFAIKRSYYRLVVHADVQREMKRAKLTGCTYSPI